MNGETGVAAGARAELGVLKAQRRSDAGQPLVQLLILRQYLVKGCAFWAGVGADLWRGLRRCFSPLFKRSFSFERSVLLGANRLAGGRQSGGGEESA